MNNQLRYDQQNLFLHPENAPWKVEARAGRKVESIKSLRAAYGFGLKEAKDIAEEYLLILEERERNKRDWAERVVEIIRTTPYAMEWKILTRQGRLVDAIKSLRQKEGFGLKEGKDIVEAYKAEWTTLEAVTGKAAEAQKTITFALPDNRFAEVQQDGDDAFTLRIIEIHGGLTQQELYQKLAWYNTQN